MWRILVLVLAVAMAVPYPDRDPVGDWVKSNGFVNEGTEGSAWNPTLTDGKGFKADAGYLGENDFTIMVQFIPPTNKPTENSWLLHYGQTDSDALHWYHVKGYAEMMAGVWGVSFGFEVELTAGEETTMLVTSASSDGEYSLYVNGAFMGSDTYPVDITSKKLYVGYVPDRSVAYSTTQLNYKDEEGADIRRVVLWDYILNFDDINSTVFATPGPTKAPTLAPTTTPTVAPVEGAASTGSSVSSGDVGVTGAVLATIAFAIATFSVAAYLRKTVYFGSIRGDSDPSP